VSDNHSLLLSQLYRDHFGKMVAVLMYHTGIEDMGNAEDIVQEAFAIAADKWRKTIPAEPEGWLYKTARNIAYNGLKRDKRREAIQDNHPFADQEPGNDRDLLGVLFGCLQPALAPKVQLVIVLRYICGLRAKRIAALLASNEDSIAKVLYRWRAQQDPGNFVLADTASDPGEQKARMALKILYVMFTAGYQLAEDGGLADEGLCEDAVSLLQQMMEAGIEANGEVKALYALLLFNLARAASRTNRLDELLTLAEQDRTGWNPDMIAVASHYLLLSQKESLKVSAYQLEAAIAYKHTQAASFDETDWKGIIRLYARLVSLDTSPFTKLGQAAALYFARDQEAAIQILNQLHSNPFFQNYPLIHCFWAKIYTDRNDTAHAITCYKKALTCTANAFEVRFIKKEIDKLVFLQWQGTGDR
jgi:RNA polymerase sigma-70 factor (ECF subfamily)